MSEHLEQDLTLRKITNSVNKIHLEDGSEKATASKDCQVLNNKSTSSRDFTISAENSESNCQAITQYFPFEKRRGGKTPTIKRNVKSYDKNSSKRKLELFVHCDEASPMFSQNHSISSHFNSNCISNSRFQVKPLSKRKQRTWAQRRQSYSRLPNAQPISHYKLHSEVPAQPRYSLYRTCEPGLIALTNGKHETILLKCSCKVCTKNLRKSYRHSRGASWSTTSGTIRQRPKPSKNGKQHKSNRKRVLSSKSYKSSFSSATK